MKVYRENINDALLRTRMKAVSTELKIPRVSELCYEYLRGEIKVFLEKLIQRIIHVMAYFKQKTVTMNVIYAATEKYYPIPKLKSCFHQHGNPPCLVFPKSPFQRFIREIVQDEEAKLRFEKDSLISLQLLTEHYLRHFLQNGRRIMQLTKRKTLYPKDLMVVEKIATCK
jgi:histone H3/H4